MENSATHCDPDEEDGPRVSKPPISWPATSFRPTGSTSSSKKPEVKVSRTLSRTPVGGQPGEERERTCLREADALAIRAERNAKKPSLQSARQADQLLLLTGHDAALRFASTDAV